MNEIISAAVLLILIMDPLGNLPIFMSVLKHTEPKRRRAIMVRELLIALLVMLVFLLVKYRKKSEPKKKRSKSRKVRK